MDKAWWDDANIIAAIAVIVSVVSILWSTIQSAIQNKNRNKFEQKQAEKQEAFAKGQVELQNAFAIDQANQRNTFEKEQAQARIDFEKELAKRREDLDREFAEKSERLEYKLRSNQSFADYHLQKRENLSQLLSNMTIAKGYFDDARNMGLAMRYTYGVDHFEGRARLRDDDDPEYVRQNELRKSFIAKGTEAATLALANAEQYGHFPQEIELDPPILAPFAERVIRSKLMNLHAYHMTDDIIKESNEHVSKLKHDIRTLMQIELVLAERIYSNNLTESKLYIPNLFYLEQCTKHIRIPEPDSSQMDFSHMEK